MNYTISIHILIGSTMVDLSCQNFKFHHGFGFLQELLLHVISVTAEKKTAKDNRDFTEQIL